MNNPDIVLFRKELRQNSFIYLFPFILVITVLFFQKVLTQLLSATWTKNLAVAVPVALAFSYALQAFDLEENSQTRDFLLTKPLSSNQIIVAKYLSGLLVLLPLTLLWQFGLVPDLIRWPDLLNINSFWMVAYFLLVVIIYNFSFTIGAWVKGPKKLLAAVLASTLGVLWFFYGWLQLFTMLYMAPINESLSIHLALLIVTLFLLFVLSTFLIVTIESKLLNHSLTEIFPRVKRYLPLLFFPLVFGAINLVNNPEIRPFNSLFACLNGSEEPFWTVDIAKQPRGDLYALTDIRGRLGIAKRGKTPTVIYQGEKSAGNLLSKLIWAPDGHRIAFNENGTIKVLSLSENKPRSLINGEFAFWSADSNILLAAAKENPAPVQANDNREPFNRYRLSYIALESKEHYELQGTLFFPGSSLFWHSSRNTILAITHMWEIAVMNLNDGKVKLIKMPPPPDPGPIFLTKIAPAGSDSYRIAVFTDLKVLNTNKNRFRYNLHLYNFSIDSQKPVLETSLKGLKFQDVLIDAGDGQVWGGNSFGVYRKINLP